MQQVTNLYGPTEATTYATWGDVERETEGAVTIGRPVDGTQVYILDQEQQLVPVGVSGELYLGGEGLARGYLGRAEVTAEKFVPHPYSGKAGARLYRTGDIGRYRVDGEIEYQGRRDQQVKVRGFRIELGEVEAVLRQHTGIREAVVLAREDEPGDKRLVAYVVWEREVGVSELREWLKQQLPEYMVPAGYVWLAELPLTANGKVDRGALPAPEGTRPELADSYVAPRTAIEEVVAGIWSEVLKVERVGVHDNFFELGGHSLLATQVISKLRRSFEVEVPLRSLFTDPTVAGLSHNITEAQRSGNYYCTMPIGRISREQYRVTAAIGRVD
jgi:acyl carrier protein